MVKAPLGSDKCGDALTGAGIRFSSLERIAPCAYSSSSCRSSGLYSGVRPAWAIASAEVSDERGILLLAPDSNPEQVSIPYVTYSHAAALAQINDVTIVVRSTVEGPVRRAQALFRAIEVVRMPWLERLYAWGFRRIFKSNFASQAVTAFGYPFALAFEWYAWRQLRRRIFAGEFDVAMRIVPMTAVLPSPFAFFLRKGPIPFVIGPINGGLPFVKGFSQASGQKEWLSSLRGLYRFMPFARSTYRNATAIIAA